MPSAAAFGLAVVGIVFLTVGVGMLPGLRLSDLAHESGHAVVASVSGYDVVGIALDPHGSAVTYTSFDPQGVHGARDHILGSMVLTSGIGGAAAFAGGLLFAVSRMRTGRRIVLGVAAGLIAVAVYWVPDDAELRSRGIAAPTTNGYTWTYSIVVAVVLLVAALPGGRLTRATAYMLAAVACVGLGEDLRELWFPSQHPTDAHLAESLTRVPVELWRIGWTVDALLLVAGPLVLLVRSTNGWPLQRCLFSVQPAPDAGSDADRPEVTV